jgi:hypothetical protein
MAEMLSSYEYADSEEFLAEHGPGKGCRLVGTPYIAEGGWDARKLECDTHHVFVRQVRGIPAEGVLINPDPHLPPGAKP